MKVSLIMATYNRAGTIADAVASVQRQSHTNLELIVVDGGSTDGTQALLPSLLDSRARFVSGPDDGIYDALNKGMALATGDVIGVIHSDDYFASDDVLAAIVAGFAPGIDAVYGDVDHITNDTPPRLVRAWRSGAYSRARLAWGWMPPHPALFVRSSVITRLGGYNTGFRVAGDYDAILRWFGAGGITPAYVPHVVMKMRVGGASNGSLKALIRKTCEDYRALRHNHIGGLGALIWKNLSKLGQFRLG